MWGGPGLHCLDESTPMYTGTIPWNRYGYITACRVHHKKVNPCGFYTVPTALNGVSWRAERLFVRKSRNIWLCTTNKRLYLEAPILKHLCKLTRYIRQLTFIQMVNVLDLNFQDQRFKTNTLLSSYVIILQTVTVLLLPRNRKSLTAIRLAYFH